MNKAIAVVLVIGGILLIAKSKSKAEGLKEEPAGGGGGGTGSVVPAPNYIPVVPIVVNSLHNPFGTHLRDRLMNATQLNGYTRSEISATTPKPRALGTSPANPRPNAV